MDVRGLEPSEDVTPPVPTEQNQVQADGGFGSAEDGGMSVGLKMSVRLIRTTTLFMTREVVRV